VLIYNPRLLSRASLSRTVMRSADPNTRQARPVLLGRPTSRRSSLGAARAREPRPSDSACRAECETSGNPVTRTRLIPSRSDVTGGSAGRAHHPVNYWVPYAAEIAPVADALELAHFAPHDSCYSVESSGAGIPNPQHRPRQHSVFLLAFLSAAGQGSSRASLSYDYPIASGVGPPRPRKPRSASFSLTPSARRAGTGSAAGPPCPRAGPALTPGRPGACCDLPDGPSRIVYL